MEKRLPHWILELLEIQCPVLTLLEKQTQALTEKIVTQVRETKVAFSKGLGELTPGVVGGEVMDWQRFKNRVQISSGVLPENWSMCYESLMAR